MTPDIRSEALRLRIRDFECEFLLDLTSCVPLLEIEIMEKCIRLGGCMIHFVLLLQNVVQLPFPYKTKETFATT